MYRFALYISCLAAYLCLTTVSRINGQSTPIDSLEKLLPFVSFSERVAMKNQIWDFLEGVSDPNERLAYSQQYVEIAESYKDSLHQEFALWQLAESYRLLGDKTKENRVMERQLKFAVACGWSLGDFTPDYPTNSPWAFLEVIRRIIRDSIFSICVFSHFVPGGEKQASLIPLFNYVEREVTVLFTDIRSYTSLAETMTPEENFKFVNAFHGRMGPIIQKHQGFVNQYLGDAIMAIFAAGPENALQAGIEMQQRLREYNRQREAAGRQAIQMGVGLHTGRLIMGVIGDQNRMDAATIADTVNTASRIEGLTKYYGTSILLSEDSFRQMKDGDHFHFRYLGKVQVKGKKEPVGLFECYDGEAMEPAAIKLKTQPDFEKALHQFFAREFPEAAAIFSKVLKTNPNDQTARLFLNKSSIYTVEGVSDDWTGVEVMTFK